MVEKLIDIFRFHDEKEDFGAVILNISNGVEFRGPTLWVLVFAIIIASLGLNINSTAVIIGAMLISPLMGPILGIGLGAGINDLALVKRAVKHYTYAIGVGLITSTLYFAVSPLSDAYSELLARTTPTIYDVLIAFMGGMAGITATTSKQKGNVIAGAAIATALMPPLCTAGYGIATMKFSFIAGALYLFTINTVFIALATLITVRFLKFPVKHINDEKTEVKHRRIIMAIIIVTLVPSIYSGYLMIQDNRFNRQANQYIEAFSSVEGNYLLNKQVDPRKKEIVLIYGGNEISAAQIGQMKEKLKVFGLEGADLQVKQGFSFLDLNKENSKVIQLSKTIQEKEIEISKLKSAIDSVRMKDTLSYRIYSEMKTLFPYVSAVSVSNLKDYTGDKITEEEAVLIKNERAPDYADRKKINEWLKKRMDNEKLNVLFMK